MEGAGRSPSQAGRLGSRGATGGSIQLPRRVPLSPRNPPTPQPLSEGKLLSVWKEAASGWNGRPEERARFLAKTWVRARVRADIMLHSFRAAEATEVEGLGEERLCPLNSYYRGSWKTSSCHTDIHIHLKKANLSARRRTRFGSSLAGERARRRTSGSTQRPFARPGGRAFPAPRSGPASLSASGRAPAGPPNAPGRPVGDARRSPAARSRPEPPVRGRRTHARPRPPRSVGSPGLPRAARDFENRNPGSLPCRLRAAPDWHGEVDALVHAEARFINGVNGLALHHTV